MKKIMVTFLAVALMSSFASAALIAPQINGQVVTEITLQPSDTIEIDLITDVGLYGIDAIVDIEGPGSLDLTGNTAQASAGYGWDASLSFDPAVLPTGVEFGYGNFSGNNGPIVLPLIFHCDGPGDVLLTFRNGTAFGGTSDFSFGSVPIEGQILIHQIPEPMTLSLLGLGGLGLLRRRRA